MSRPYDLHDNIINVFNVLIEGEFWRRNKELDTEPEQSVNLTFTARYTI